MRNIILSFLAVFAATSLFAQKFEIGVNGGISYDNRQNDGFGGLGAIYGWAPVNLAYMSAKFMRISPKWQYGLSLDYCPFTTMSEQSKFSGDVGEPFPGTSPQWEQSEFYTRYWRSYCLPMKLFVNRKIHLNHFESYAGLSLGTVFWKAGSLDLSQSTFTYSAGLQMGCTYYISKAIGINAEVGGDFISTETYGTTTICFFSVPVTIGIRYKI